jgi:hypothetical protein
MENVLLAPKNDSRATGKTDYPPDCLAANFAAAMLKSVEPEPTMKFRMSRILRFWVECEFPDYRAQHSNLTKSQRIAAILREFEAAGDAMRYLGADGRVAWKATPRMLIRLADAEREAKDDLADWP